MAEHTSVGNIGVHGAGDQRNLAESEQPHATRYEEGQENSHQPNDSKDQRSIANRLACEEQRSHEDDPETAAMKQDPTLAARMHGNEPSRGAKIDAEIQREEEEYLQRKGKA